MRNTFITLILLGFVLASCKSSSSQSELANEIEDDRFVRRGGDEIISTKLVFNFFDANRTPFIRVWWLKHTDNYRRILAIRMFELSRFRSRDFAGFFGYELVDNDLPHKLEVRNKHYKECQPKSGWEAFNQKIEKIKVWEVPRFPIWGRTGEEYGEATNSLFLEIIPKGDGEEYYKLYLPVLKYLDTAKSEKARASLNLLLLIKEEFGYDFINESFPK